MKHKLLSIINKINNTDKRTINIQIQILKTFLIKFGSIIIQFAIVPVILNFVTQIEYGVWVTISTFINWFYLFDVGFGNGLKNKLTESLAIKDYEQGKIYVSTTYFIITIISSIIIFLFFIVEPYITWTKVFNAPNFYESQIKQLMRVVIVLFSLQFIFQLLNVVLTSDQKNSKASLLGFLSSLLILIILFSIRNFIKGDILVLGSIFMAAPMIVYFIASLYYYNKTYKIFKPSFRLIKIHCIEDITILGLKFFIIQIGVIFLYQMSTILISNFYLPSEVIPYNTAFSLFSILSVAFSVIVTPLWAACTDAYIKNDFIWISKTIKKMIYLWGLLSIGGLFLLILSQKTYSIWVPSIKIDYLFSIYCYFYVIVLNWNSIFISFVNGIGKIKLQLYLIIFIIPIYIPFAYLFDKILNIGPSSLLITMIFFQLIIAIAITIQYKKIINKNSKGIWNE